MGNDQVQVPATAGLPGGNALPRAVQSDQASSQQTAATRSTAPGSATGCRGSGERCDMSAAIQRVRKKNEAVDRVVGGLWTDSKESTVAGLKETAWLYVAGLALAAKGGIIAKHWAAPAVKRLEHFDHPGVEQIRVGLARMESLSTWEAMKVGVGVVSRPFARLPAGEKVILVGLLAAPAVVAHFIKKRASRLVGVDQPKGD